MPMSRNLGPSVAAERFMAQADAVEARLVQHAAARRGCERVMVAGDPCPVEPCGQRQKPPPRLLVQSNWSLPIMEAVAQAPEFARAGFIDQRLSRRQCRIALLRWQHLHETRKQTCRTDVRRVGKASGSQ